MNNVLFLFCIFVHVAFFSNEEKAREYPVFQLDDLDLSSMKLLKKKIWAANYLSEEEGVVYKVWNPGYEKGPKFLEALRRGFFEEISPLIGLIYDKHECRGYLTRRCQPLGYNGFVMETFLDYNKQRKRIAGYDLQNDAYKALYEMLIDLACQTSYFYSDLTPANMVQEGERLLIIDLESVEPLKNLTSRKVMKRSLAYHPQDYVRAIRKIHSDESLKK